MKNIMREPKYKNFLFEIGTEELPPKQIGKLVSLLAENLVSELKKYALAHETVKTYSTPRRLAVLIGNLITKQPDQPIELRGPPVGIIPAAEKFAKTCGVNIEQLSHIEDEKGKFLFYKTIKTGKDTAELLPEIIINSIKKLPLARSMRWSNSEVCFIRPVHWIVMLFGTEIIHTQILGKDASNKTFGHRFHHHKVMVILEAGLYEELLEKHGFVIADTNKRKQKIREQIINAANKENGAVIINESLLDEVTGLVEWPVALVGSFDSKFLKLPKEVLIISMEKQQRYFAIINKKKELLSNFVIIANIESKNSKVVISGNERVLNARLTDAEYFYNNDMRTALINYSDKLKTVVFQEKLGSLYNKALRIKNLASFIATKLNANVEQAERAAELSKCDLMTLMVREFPELQGIMGDYYARTCLEKETVATAIREQYLPRFSQDEIPTTDIGCVLALSDRIDTLIGMFGINKIPSGEKDPFGLRRAAAGIVRIILEKKLDLNLLELLEQAQLNYSGVLGNNNLITQALHFIHERFRYMYAEQNKDANTFHAVLVCQPYDLIDFEKRFEAVDKFNKLAEANDLIEIYKRIKNILNKAEASEKINADFNKELIIEQVERNLAEFINKESKAIDKLYRNKNYFEILNLLVKAKPVLNNFFDEVMVMSEDKKIMFNRLALLKDLQKLFKLVADWGV